MPISRAISACCWSRAKTSLCAMMAFSCAPSRGSDAPMCFCAASIPILPIHSNSMRIPASARPASRARFRAGKVAFANALGAGFVESRALLGFMPSLARRLLGEDLKLANVATWWCGQTPQRDEVIARLNELAIAPAFSPASSTYSGVRIGADLTNAERGAPDRCARPARHGLRGARDRLAIDHAGLERGQAEPPPVPNPCLRCSHRRRLGRDARRFLPCFNSGGCARDLDAERRCFRRCLGAERWTCRNAKSCCPPRAMWK